MTNRNTATAATPGAERPIYQDAGLRAVRPGQRASGAPRSAAATGTSEAFPWVPFSSGRTDTVSRDQLTALLRHCLSRADRTIADFAVPGARIPSRSHVAWQWMIGILDAHDGLELAAPPAATPSIRATDGLDCVSCGAALDLPGSVVFPVPGTLPLVHICAVCEDKFEATRL